MSTNNAFGNNYTYQQVKKNSNFGKFKDSKGVDREHKFAKLIFLSKDIYHKDGSKSVACTIRCHLYFNIPAYWRTDLTDYTTFDVVGVATCADGDEFNFSKGKLIAQAKAENEAYKVAARMLATLQKQLLNFANAIDSPLIELGEYVEHNEKFIERVVEGEIKPKY